MPSHIHEPPPGRTPPVRYARRLALAKAKAVALGVRHRRCLTPLCILGADTIVVAGRQILGKPRSVAEAERMLRRLSGTTHRVITAVALGVWRRRCLTPSCLSVAHAISRVTMRRLTEAEIRRAARRHRDKAGAYAVQDADDPVVTQTVGSYTNVVGLPQEVVLPLLRQAGIQITPGTALSNRGRCAAVSRRYPNASEAQRGALRTIGETGGDSSRLPQWM